MKNTSLFLTAFLTLSSSVFAATAERTTLNFDCLNKSEKALQKSLRLTMTLSTYQNGKKHIYATVETKRDIFELYTVKGDAKALDTDYFSVDIGGADLDANYRLALSQPIDEQLGSFDASWKLLLNEQAVNLGEGISNPEQFSCQVGASRLSTIPTELKEAADEYIKSLGDEWNVVGKKMTHFDFTKGFLGKETRRMERTGDYNIEGHRVQLKVNGVDVTVFVVTASQEESASLAVYTDKGEFVSEVEYNN